MKRFGMTLRSAPPGLLITVDGVLAFKTEYCREGTATEPDVYVVASGERYWGTDSGGLDALCWEVTGACEEAARDAMELPEVAEAAKGEQS